MDGYYAWMIVATAFVLMMTMPGLALFYGGMTRAKSVLNMMMMSYVAMASSASSGCSGAGRWPSAATGSATPTARSIANPFTLFGLSDVTHATTTSTCCSS